MNGLLNEFKQMLKEHTEIKKKLKKMERSFAYFQKALQHEEDIRIARKDKRNIPFEKIVHELGF
ncbi:MAG: hypothetical protein A3C88_02280 [Candidatus Yanofskybacteria bacterium RIFCSPHIGHO2_02_FULL_50_12]|uniref:Uncharacterized protein n=1 Tax=Candidatus Yanofskybacteria bacterium RIFCSPHIGHO2_02_FULL_50_12 TaxID=1802685 RepID=A0A1F8FTZ5_9BACT|nr:MAG: hypothetical protein A3C88_02280 [Candidatus Yanofskybacteria bacterium RIFCSPHIGHO2_02_FULL_50_12]